MNLNSDAVQNVKWQRMNFESGVVKASTDDAGILSPDIAYSGMTAYVEAGTTISILDFLAYGNTANAIVLADATDATLPCVAIALEAGVDGGMIKVLLWGYLKAANLDFGVHAYTAFTMSTTYVVADNEHVTINGQKYEYTVDGTTTGVGTIAMGSAEIGVAIYVEELALSTLIAAINANDPLMTAVLTSTHVVTITATGIDIAATGNAVTTTTDVTLGALTSTVMAGGTNGNKVYLSDTGGDFTLTATPTTYQVLGQALSMHELFFKPDNYMIAS